jgi:hypothetical protein
MCWCTPTMRTPCCGKLECRKPSTNVTPEETRQRRLSKPNAWIGVDLDGTLAEHTDDWDGGIGKPIDAMVTRVKEWINAGINVRILTARVHPSWDEDRKQRFAIYDWCSKVFGRFLPITCMKDPNMLELWDDRAVHVVCNTGMTEEELKHYNG